MKGVLSMRKLSSRILAAPTAMASFALLLLGGPSQDNVHRCMLWSAASAVRQRSSGRNSTRLTFTNVAMGEISDRTAAHLGLKTEGHEGVRLGFTLYLASDGVRLTAKQGKFASASEAERYLDSVVGRSAKVLKRGRMNDKSGKLVGHRAEVVLKQNKSITEYGVLWTSGPWFQEIDSTSLQDNLALLDR